VANSTAAHVTGLTHHQPVAQQGMVWHGGLTLHYFRIILLYFFKKYNITQVLNKASFTLRQKANTLCN
jgi:hypothetical protein